MGMVPEEQRQVFAFLSSPAAHAAEKVERIDTHISAVFLAGNRALKVKRAVRLPFLDFSTLEARRAACQAEVVVNRRAAPELYRGVATVNRDADGRLSVGGAGEVVEWLVVMNRFEQAALFDRMADAGTLTRPLVLELARVVAEFHRSARPTTEHGGAEGIAWTVGNNDECLRAHVPAVFAAEPVGRLAAQARAGLDRLAPLLDRRRRSGQVRHCHGDLHLANICLYDERPTLFDAIEFSEAIACVDVFYDLAFLLMDLDCRDHRYFASLVLNHYVELTGDVEALAALPLFLSCRAAIRAHVSATMADGAAAEEAARRRRDAVGYLERALAYLAPPPPRLIAVGGLSGSGKSRLARELAPFVGAAPGALVVRSDVLRKRLMGVDQLEKLGEDGYSAEMTRRTYEAVCETARLALVAGQSVVADAVFARPEERAAIEAAAAAAGVTFAGLWLDAPPEIMGERIAGRRRNASDATVEVLRRQMTYDIGEIGWARLDSSGKRGDTVTMARRALGI